MTAYNVINAPSMSAGQPEDVSQVLANFQAIATVLNGNLDNGNIIAGANIAASKFAGYPADATKFLRGDGAWSVISSATGSYSAAISGATTDLPAPTGAVNLIFVSAGGGALRSIGAPTAGTGSIVSIYASGNVFTIRNGLAGGTGALVYPQTRVDTVISGLQTIAFQYDGTEWLEIARTNSSPSWTIGSSPPSFPNNGDIWVYNADPVNGVYWTFVYDSTQATFRWRFIGGPAQYAEVQNAESCSGGYTSLATAGPSIPLARQGDYDISIGFDITSNSVSTTQYMSYDIGAIGAVDADSAKTKDTYMPQSVMRTRRKPNIAGSSTILAKYRASAGTNTVENRWMSILPVRVI